MLKDLASDASILQWFGFENRLRHIINEMVHPIKDSHLKLEDRMGTIDNSIAITCRRIEEHDFVLMKEKHESATVDDVRS
jgi:hypothetical protein